MVSTCSLLPNPVNGRAFPLPLSMHKSPAANFRPGEPYSARVTQRIKGQALRVLANPNGSSGKSSSGDDILMVDPLEAKRLAAKQMEEIRAKEKFKRRRRIEAINGAWAMIGLTAGLVIEGHTGKSIIEQVKLTCVEPRTSLASFPVYDGVSYCVNFKNANLLY